MNRKWTRIVCYGLGNFIPDPERERKYLNSFCERNGVTFKKEVFEKIVNTQHHKPCRQLEFLKQLQQSYNVPTFVYDPLFTAEEVKVLKQLGFHVLDRNLDEFLDHTLYYLPFCPYIVSDAVLTGHTTGHTIGIIGNPANEVCNISNLVCLRLPIKVSRTRSEFKLYHEQFIVEF